MFHHDNRSIEIVLQSLTDEKKFDEIVRVFGEMLPRYSRFETARPDQRVKFVDVPFSHLEMFTRALLHQVIFSLQVIIRLTLLIFRKHILSRTRAPHLTISKIRSTIYSATKPSLKNCSFFA